MSTPAVTPDPYASIAVPVSSDPYASIAKPLQTAQPETGNAFQRTVDGMINYAEHPEQRGAGQPNAVNRFAGGALRGSLGVLAHPVDAIQGALQGMDYSPQAAQRTAANDPGVAATLGGVVGNTALIGGMEAPIAKFAPSLPSLIDKFPTRSGAGEIFNKLNTKLADQPVPLSSSSAPLQRAIEIAARGGTMPNAVNALLQRSQAIEPMTFPEARDYQASLSDLSASDKMAMNGRMRGAVAQLNQALYQDIRTAAEQGGGMGADYDKAMSQYKTASQIRNGVNAGAKYAGKAAAGAALGSAGYGVLKYIQESR